MKRPAESAGVAGAIAALIARITGVSDPDTITYIAVGVGIVPALVTFVVVHGGLRGVLGLVWHGQKGYAAVEVLVVLALVIVVAVLAAKLSLWFLLLLILAVLLLA